MPSQGQPSVSKAPAKVRAASLTGSGPVGHFSRGGIAGFLKMKRDCFIGPRVFELMAAIAADDDAHAQPPRGFREAARLIAELTRKQEQRWRFFGNHALCRKL